MRNSTGLRRPAAAIVATAIVCCTTTVAQSAGARPLTSVVVEERDGLARKDWPLTFGLPLPHGLVGDATAIALSDESGGPLPVQASVRARWPDGSARWVLVDTQVSLAPHATRRMRLELSGPGIHRAPAAPLKVRESAQSIAVDTGVLSFEIPKTEFAVLAALGIRAAGACPTGAMGAWVETADGVLRAAPPASVTILENGPLRARIALRGTYGSGFDYLIRVEAYADQPFVRILHTFINRNPAPRSTIRRLALDMPLRSRGPVSYRFGVERGRPRSGSVAEEALRLVQPDNLAFRVGEQNEDGRLAGWTALRVRGLNIGIAGRWFWQEYPKAIEIRPDALVYELWASEGGNARAGVGAAKTHELWFWAAPRTFERAAADPLVARLDPAWVAESGALPHALAPSGAGGAFVTKAVEAARRYLRRNSEERWDDRGEARCEGRGGERPRVGAYGVWNWGDWNFPKYQDSIKGCDAWGNLEYDTTEVLALAFASSGEEFLHDAMTAAARHFMDVDVIHFFPLRLDWVGMNHPKNPLHWSFELGGVDLGHTWTEGLLSYFFLSGDERGLEAARGIADYLAERIRGFVRGNPRQWGWPQIALVAVFDATGERKYLDAAREYAKRGMAAHEPTAIEKWKLGILADGLAYTHARSGDAEIAAWLDRYAQAVVGRRIKLDARLYPAVAYLAATKGSPQLRAAALERARKLDLGSWGKPFTINGRLGFRIYSLLDGGKGFGSPPTPAAGATPGPTDAPQPLLRLTTSPLR